MYIEGRLKLDMASRVRDFFVSHPTDDASYTPVLARLQDRIQRAEVLAAQQRSGEIAVQASTARRSELRRLLRTQPLRHLLRIAEAASKEEPEVFQRFRLPRNHSNHRDFLTAARSIVEEAKVQHDLFVRYGLSQSLIDDLTATLNEYDKAVTEAHDGKISHVGALADLKSVMKEIMDVVKQLDGMNQYRLRNDTEQRAAWESARNIAWPLGTKPAAPAPTPTPAPAPVVTPPSGAVEEKAA